jgi:hypothetical protein
MAFDILSAVQFVTVAEELSFTRAAARLGIAQPWLSRRIQLLEAQLGFRLFVRTTRRIELTEKGEAFGRWPMRRLRRLRRRGCWAGPSSGACGSGFRPMAARSRRETRLPAASRPKIPT